MQDKINPDNLILTFTSTKDGLIDDVVTITLSELLDSGIPIDEDGDDMEFRKVVLA